jgi:hypothetical protein
MLYEFLGMSTVNVILEHVWGKEHLSGGAVWDGTAFRFETTGLILYPFFNRQCIDLRMLFFHVVVEYLRRKKGLQACTGHFFGM